MTRVALIADVYEPGDGSGYGGSKYLQGLRARLLARGVEARIFARSGARDGVITIGRRFTSGPDMRKLDFSADLWRQRSEFASYDMIHSQSASSLPFLDLMRFRVPTLFDCRTSFVRTSRALALMHLAFLSVLRPTAVAFCDVGSLREYVGIFAPRPRYLPVPIEIPPEVKPLRDIRSIGFASQLTKEKGIDVAIQAAVELRRRGRDIVLRIAGEGPERGLVERSAGLWPGLIEYQGSLGFTEARLMVRECDVLLLPSKTESISRVVLEALADGIPVVARSLPGHVELQGIGAIHVAPDASAVADRVLWLDQEPRAKAEAARLGREFVATNNTWAAFERALTDCYRSLGVGL